MAYAPHALPAQVQRLLGAIESLPRLDDARELAPLLVAPDSG
jgi:hypothetical protein